MRIQIVARHCSPAEATRERAITQFDRLQRYHPRLQSAEVIFREEKLEKEIEGVLVVAGHERVVAHGAGETFDIAIDRAVERLSRQLRDMRSRDRDHQALPLSEAVPPTDASEPEEAVSNDLSTNRASERA